MGRKRVHADLNERVAAWRERKRESDRLAEIERQRVAEVERQRQHDERAAREAVPSLVQQWFEWDTGGPGTWQEVRVWLAQQIAQFEPVHIVTAAAAPVEGNEKQEALPI